MRKVKMLDPRDAEVQLGATGYNIFQFRGRENKITGHANTFGGALDLASHYWAEVARPVAIYAELGRRASHVVNYEGRPIVMTYALSYEANKGSITITRYVSKKAADAGLALEPGGVLGIVFESQLDILATRLSGPTMVTLFNALREHVSPGSAPVTRFATRDDGARRIFEIVELGGKNLPVLSAPAAPAEKAEEPVQPDAKEEADVAKKAVAKARKPRATKNGTAVSPDMKITVLVDENPRLKGTKAHKQFELYTSGMKVSTFVEKGGRMSDVAWDIARKHISVG